MASEEIAESVQAPPGAKPRTPWGYADMALAVGLVIAGTVAITVPAAVVGAVIAGDDEIDEDPAALAVVLGASLALEVVMLLAAALFSIGKYGASWGDLGLRRPRRGGFWLPIVLAVAGLATVYLYVAVLDAAGAEPDSTIPDEAFDSLGPLLLLAALSLVFAPLVEEVFFRGFLFAGFRGRWGLVWAALASGTLFALAHLGNPGTAYVVLPIAIIGALFALGYAYSGSLLATIGAHFLFNLVTFLAGLATT